MKSRGVTKKRKQNIIMKKRPKRITKSARQLLQEVIAKTMCADKVDYGYLTCLWIDSNIGRSNKKKFKIYLFLSIQINDFLLQPDRKKVLSTSVNF